MDSREAIKKQFLKEYEKGDFQSITVKGLCYQGAFTKIMGFGSRFVPRSVGRRADEIGWRKI